jgi:hypothetical protein
MVWHGSQTKKRNREKERTIRRTRNGQIAKKGRGKESRRKIVRKEKE